MNRSRDGSVTTTGDKTRLCYPSSLQITTTTTGGSNVAKTNMLKILWWCLHDTTNVYMTLFMSWKQWMILKTVPGAQDPYIKCVHRSDDTCCLQFDCRNTSMASLLLFADIPEGQWPLQLHSLLLLRYPKRRGQQKFPLQWLHRSWKTLWIVETVA